MTREEYGAAFERGHGLTTVALQGHGFDRTEAEEISSAAWDRGWERLSQLRDARCVVPWVTAIAIHSARDEISRRSRLCSLGPEHDKGVEPKVDTLALEVDGVLRKCTPQQCKLLQLRLEGYSIAELARMFGTSQDAMRHRISRAVCAAKRHATNGRVDR